MRFFNSIRDSGVLTHPTGQSYRDAVKYTGLLENTEG